MSISDEAGKAGAMPPWRRHGGLLLVAAVAAFLALRGLLALDAAPPGLSTGEASLGYNAWAIGHHGVDEHGAAFPLYFLASGEYRSPLYVYVLAPLIDILGPSPAVVRLPAALFGLIATAATALLAWRITRSGPITLAALVVAGLTPWLVLAGRVASGSVTTIALISVLLWCVAAAQDVHPGRWYFAAGIAAGLGVYSSVAGRLAVAPLAIALIACCGLSRESARRWVFFAAPVAVAYAALGLWILRNPGTLLGGDAGGTVLAGGASPLTALGRFARNYLLQWDPVFLWVGGDSDLRHSTGFEGMLLVAGMPLVLAGIAVCLRRRHELLPRFVIAGALLGPLGASWLRQSGGPDAVAGAAALPFLLALTVFGMVGLRDVLAQRRVWITVLAAAVAVEAVGFHTDLVRAYPTRAALAFNVPGNDALLQAHRLAAGHRIWLSNRLPLPDAAAFFELLPSPPERDLGSASTGRSLRLLGISRLGANGAGGAVTQSGDILVLSATEMPPNHAEDVLDEIASGRVAGVNGPITDSAVVIRVWRAH